MVRLYRGETAQTPSTPVPDYVKETPEYKATVEASGRWFSGTKEEAQYYVDKFGQPGNKITYVDVPAAEVDKHRAANQPEATRFAAGAENAQREFFVPKEVADKRAELSSAPAKPAVDLKLAPSMPTAYKILPSLHSSPHPETDLKPVFSKRDPDNPHIMDTTLTGKTDSGNSIVYFYGGMKPIAAMEYSGKKLVKRYKPEDIQFPHVPIQQSDLELFDKDTVHEVLKARSRVSGDYNTISKQGESLESVDKIHKAVANRIRSMAGDVQTYVIPDHLMPSGGPEGVPPPGFYNGEHHQIVINERAMDFPGEYNSTMLHEGVHASIDHAMLNNPHIAAAVREAAKATRDSLGEDKWKELYASSVPREFMTESLSKQTLRDHLIKTPTTPAVTQAIADLEKAHGVPQSRIQNMWDAVKAITKRVFKIAPHEESLFDSILKISAHAERQLQKTPAGPIPDTFASRLKYLQMSNTMSEPGLWQEMDPWQISPREHLDSMMKSMETTPVDKR
jgi:hypothetical protein